MQSPLTCGSYSRRAAIKYFLRDGLSGADGLSSARSMIVSAVRALVAKLFAAWVTDDNFLAYQCQCDNGTHAYGCCTFDCTFDAPCACPNGGAPSYACCGCTSTSLLPSVLQVPFTSIPGNDTLSGVIDRAAAYLSTTIWTSTAPWLKYDAGAPAAFDWSTSDTQAHMAADHALFDTTNDVVAYNELGTPFVTNIWEMCLGLVGQVHHTLPLDLGTGRPTTLGTAFNPTAAGGAQSSTVNLTYTEDWVRALLTDAYARSPLFWHHSARHAPSPSTMCARSAPQPYFSPTASSNSTNNNTTIPPTYGWYALTLGGARVDCYCGWWYNATHCKPPAGVCALVAQVAYTPSQPLCPLYAAGAFDMDTAMRAVHDQQGGAWPSAWPCPALMASDHWGLFPTSPLPTPNATNATDAQWRVLRRGPSGLRAGSLAYQSQTLLMTPFQRAEPALPEPLQCGLAPPRSLVDHFVDDLFPAAQGVRQSAPVSYCLRFVVELARRLAYDQAGLTLPASEQTQIVAAWQRRCEAKLNQTAFCEAYDIFSIPGTANPSVCPFIIQAPYVGAITPSCLVVFQGVAYDPCLCVSSFCSGPTVRVLNPIVHLLNNGDLCRVPHPRDYVVDTSTGTVGWPPQAAFTAPFTAGAPDAGPTAIPPSLVSRALFLGEEEEEGGSDDGVGWKDARGEMRLSWFSQLASHHIPHMNSYRLR